MDIEENIAMLILAAGESKRMNGIKQLLPWKKTSLLGNTIEHALNSNVNEVYVVLGANSEKIKESIAKYPVQIIKNNNWKKGMGTSISCALEYFKINNLNYKAVLITLADQPLIDAKYYNLLILYFSTNKEKIIASSTNNKPSVPAIFDNSYFEKLSQLNQDKGAKELLKTVPNDIFIVNTKINMVDVDTEDAYVEIYNNFGNSGKSSK